MSIVANEEILIVDNKLTINGTEASTSATTGALVVTFGGVGFGDDLFIGNDFTSESDVNIENTLTIGSGTSSYVFPTEKGSNTDVLIFTTSNGLVFGSIQTPNQVTTLSFGVNNALLKTLGVNKEIEATGILISGADDMTGINTIDVIDTSTVGSMKVSDATSSTNATSGALLVAGGMAIGENINVGGDVNIAGNSNVNGTLQLGNSGTEYYFPNAKGASNQILVSGTDGGLVFTNEAVSANQVTSISTFGVDNAMIKTLGTDRGVESTSIIISDQDGISGLTTINVNDTGSIGGITNISNTTTSTDTTSGAMIVTGGVGVGENLNIANNLTINGSLNVNTFTIGTGVTQYNFPIEEGIENQILTVSSSGGLLFETPISNPNKVDSTLTFGTDNILVKTDGVGRNISGTGIVVSDSNDMSSINTLNVATNSTIGGTLILKSGTSSINATSGALVITGGSGISENVNVGGTLSTDGSMSVTNTIASTSTNTGALVVSGGVGVGGDMNIGGNISTNDISLVSGSFTISSTTQSVNNTSGALTVAGGIGLEGNLNIGGALNVDLTATFNDSVTIGDVTESNTELDGALVNSGGLGIAQQLSLGGVMNVNNTLESTTTSDGAFVISGGVGIAQNLNIGGAYVNNGSVIIRNGTNSVGTSSGALVVNGGMSIDKNLYADSIFLSDPLVVNSKYFMAVHTTTVSTASTSFVRLTWNTEIRKDSSQYSHTTNSDNINVLETGWYEIIVEVTSQIEAGDGGNRTIASIQLTVNNNPIAESISFIMNRTAERGHGTSNITIIQNLTANDTINVEINRISGTSTVTTVANACRIYIARI